MEPEDLRERARIASETGFLMREWLEANEAVLSYEEFAARARVCAEYTRHAKHLEAKVAELEAE